MTLQTKTATQMAAETKSHIDNKFGEVMAEFRDLEQKLARGGGGSYGSPETWGAQIARSDQLDILRSKQSDRIRIAVKEITSGSASAGGMIDPFRDPMINEIARRRPRIRDLLSVVNTNQGSVEWLKQTTRDNQAAPQVEGALKAESDYAWELQNLPIRTIAHWTRATVQILDDAPALQSTIDGELRYGLAIAEDLQLLSGDGTGVNLDGLITNATNYVADFTPANETMIDKIGLAALQVTLADYEPNGVAVHPSDWMRMRLLKDGDGKYLLGDPQSTPNPLIHGLPVVPTVAMTRDKFLVGDFARAATLYDRQEPTVAISTEDRDNFVTNRITVRAEERLALAIKNPTALSYGDFGNIA